MPKTYSGGVERRHYVRLPEEHLLVVELFSMTGQEYKSSTRVHAFTRNLSEGGVLFESAEFFQLGALLKLEIDIPGWEKYKTEFYRSEGPKKRRPFIVIAKVVRIEDLGAGIFDIGVVFTAVDAGHKLAIRKYVEHARKNIKL